MNPPRNLIVYLVLSLTLAGLAVAGESGSTRLRPTAPVPSSPPRTVPPVLPGESDRPLTESVLVVPAREMDIETTEQIIEDLSVMARIIEKNVLAPHGLRPTASRDIFLGVPLRQDAGPHILFPSTGRPKPLYIGGYGAVFFIRVDFPLLPPPEKAQEQPGGSQEDPVWAEARRALLEPGAARTAQPREDPLPPYSRERVNSVQRSLIATMRHAANIRALAPGEGLTLVVQGPGPSPAGTAPGGATVMVLRAAKDDLDLYAGNQLGLVQFEQRVQVMLY